ncbi:MAG: neutral zinc metallopeptidase [Chloroflexota bacterium]|nr:neutral zinc metallopeptidase [Chloroflexota bacterium]
MGIGRKGLIALTALLLVTACDAGTSPTSPPFSFSIGIPTATPFNVDELLERLLSDEEEFEREVSVADPARFESGILPNRPDAQATEEYVSAVIDHADTVWTAWFLQNGMEEPWVGISIVRPGDSYTSSCNLVVDSAHPNAYYCPTDQNEHDRGVIIVPIETFSKMWTGEVLGRGVMDVSRAGDFAAATIAAHEFGHHIQDELTVQLAVPQPTNPNTELLADCFAGAWAYSVFLDGYLEEGDLDEAIEAFTAIAHQSEIGSHGTVAMRQNAFNVGYYGLRTNPVPGMPANCINAFWPEFVALAETQR